MYPEPETLPAISGHRDASATECPGQLLYDQLSAIRLGTGAITSKDLSSDAVFRIQGPDRVATAIDASQFLFGDGPPGLRPWYWHARTCSRTRWPEFLSRLRQLARC